MTTLLPGRSPVSNNRRHFGWISRFYKRAQAMENDQSAMRLDHRSFDGDGAPFLGITHSQGKDIGSNDVSSLRPTISTRAPSTASNIAVHNVDITSVATGDSSETFETATDMQNSGSPMIDPQLHDDEARDVVLTPVLQDSEFEATSGCRNIVTNHAESNRQSISSIQSSKDSPIPSLFSNRTTETQPTIGNLPAASIMSSRASNANFGASDNASMLTLASSSKGPRRRRSLDTNCSMRAIAPASARGSFESSRTGLTDQRQNGSIHTSHIGNDGGALTDLSSNRLSEMLDNTSDDAYFNTDIKVNR